MKDQIETLLRRLSRRRNHASSEALLSNLETICRMSGIQLSTSEQERVRRIRDLITVQQVMES